MENENFTQPSKRRRGSRAVSFLIILLLAALVGFGWAFYNYTQAQRQLTALTDPNVRNELDKEQAEVLLKKVSRLITLPVGEDPVIATISDVESLAHEQNFYKDAQNGQKLIVYYGAQKAIIYDEKANVLVNVGPVFLKDEQGNDQPIPRMEGRLNIEIRNGSQDTTKSVVIRDDLDKDAAFNVIRLSKAANRDYGDPIIVNLIGGEKADLIKKLEDRFGVAPVGAVPEGEAGTAAEVLIILGNNK